MNVLIDTHIFLWAKSRPEFLTKNECGILEDPGNQIFFSHASAWELEIKKYNRKIDLEDEWMSYVEQMGFKWLPIQREHLLALRTLPAFHRDPFDRLLVAQARSEDLRMLSHDENVMKYFRVADPVEEVRNP